MTSTQSQTRRAHLGLLGGAFAGSVFPLSGAPVDFNTYTDAEKEKLLSSGTIVSAAEIGHGVTKPVRAVLKLAGVEHAASVQTVEKELPDFFPQGGLPPVPMKDSWRFNIAAYKLDRLLDLNMVPVTVQRAYKGKPGAFSWWVDDVMFEEVDRIKKEIAAPDPENFARQRAIGQVFDELIMNIDRNLANLLITKSWKVALIDHTRSFTPFHGIRNEANLIRCSRGLIGKMKALATDTVTAAMGKHMTPAEVRAILARRDRIVEFFERAAKAKGEDNVLFS